MFFWPLKSLLVTQSNLKKWCGAIAPSQMALFQAKSIFIPSGQFSCGAVYRMCSVGKGERKGNINDGHIKEASGLAYSRRSKEVNIYRCVPLWSSIVLIQVLWVHNDSGGSTWINAISEHGQSLA